jgi:hypothetical protein
MGNLKVRSTLNNCAPESAYEYAGYGRRDVGFIVNRWSNSGTSKREWQQQSGEAIWGRIAPINTLATRFSQSRAWLLEQSGSRLHNVKGANHHV